MPSYDAVFFDFDGVLADTEPVHWACWAEALRPLGIELTWDYYREHGVGLTDRALGSILGRCAGVPADAVLARKPEKRRLYIERILTAAPIPRPVVELVRSLSSMRLAVVTSSNIAEVGPPLEYAGIADCFGAIITPVDVNRVVKPAPDPYLAAAERLGARRPLVVEDSDAGVASGRAAGFDVLRVPNATATAEMVRAALAGAIECDTAR